MKASRSEGELKMNDAPSRPPNFNPLVSSIESGEVNYGHGHHAHDVDRSDGEIESNGIKNRTLASSKRMRIHHGSYTG
jgi:hypothetical protein